MIKHIKTIVVSSLLLVAALSSTVSAESVLIKNAKVHTLSSQGTLNNADIYVVDGVVRQVGKSINQNADKIIDAKSQVVTPGLFAIENNIGVLEIESLGQTSDSSSGDEMAGASFSLTEVFNPNSTLIPHNRSNGITRTLVNPTSNQLIAGQASVFSLNGDYDALLFNNVAMFGSFGERGSRMAGGSRATALTHLQTALDEAREYADNTASILEGDYRELFTSIADLKALQALINREVPLVVRVNRASDIKTLIRFAKRNSIRLIFSGAAEGWMVAKDIAAAKIPVILDPFHNLPRSFESLGSRIDNATLLNKAGVDLIFQSGGSHNAHNVRYAAGNSVSYGVPYEVALQAMTTTPARYFGGASDYGKIQPGYKAELVIWDGDPLEVTSIAKVVMIDGKITSMMTKAKRLRDRYKNISTDKNTPYRK